MHFIKKIAWSKNFKISSFWSVFDSEYKIFLKFGLFGFLRSLRSTIRTLNSFQDYYQKFGGNSGEILFKISNKIWIFCRKKRNQWGRDECNTKFVLHTIQDRNEFSSNIFISLWFIFQIMILIGIFLARLNTKKFQNFQLQAEIVNFEWKTQKW